ncbi:hypothetical protein SAMN02745248_00757 [Hathewaya proteolytica DSM 3090]|uniref:Prepilin-type N-terminal cleavage/methylation domain-containing protein n=1 Tax=Hathewaya proteolytica DSM 3090 TaxID=1121331 RepID=A0A1M6LH71_9CLOT|nr:type II secretion system protein [Hathewaya proteolytica]SHJ70529.1 hypothetical protein SAMN02745248_00757 [Hathewaya proteolytica DSM 3090]
MPKLIKHSRKRGTTLIEVVVAVAIFVMVGIAVMEAFKTSSLVNRSAKVTDKSNEVASNLLQSFKKNPEEFIRTNNLTGTPEAGGSSSKTTYVGSEKYDYTWNKLDPAAPIGNGYSVDYTIVEDKTIGSSIMYTPDGLDSQSGMKLARDKEKYLLYVANEPDYYGGNYYAALFRNWTHTEWDNWIKDEISPLFPSYKKDVKNGLAGCTLAHYENYRNSGPVTFNYFAYCHLLSTGINNFDADKRVYSKVDMTKEQCSKGIFPIKITEGDIDIKVKGKYNIQVINESDLDVQIYIASNNQENVDLLNKAVNVELIYGSATKTVLNVEKSAQIKYDLNINVKDYKGNIIYKLSSKEYLSK